MWTNRRREHGPFDIIGDVHGCCDELLELMTTLGYSIKKNGDGYQVGVPDRRKAIFLGDLVDRGPKIVAVLFPALLIVWGGTGGGASRDHHIEMHSKISREDGEIAPPPPVSLSPPLHGH